ncbi:MAG: YraN family protein [Paracoccaceae bacterium]|nr:YraN family protein [Paracoccaceae bacterium]MDG1737571.1 YraN family protein [Paracoccaceae bacterium]MDG2257499.1 YraN family protein [Paracoccaceae bacterium]
MTGGRTAYLAGVAAEDIVERYYRSHGYTTLSQRYRGKRGEIDLIVGEGTAVVFVEVKKSKTHDRAATRVSRAQQLRIMTTAAEYLTSLPNGQLTESRFDVALVDQFGGLKILENAIGHD